MQIALCTLCATLHKRGTQSHCTQVTNAFASIVVCLAHCSQLIQAHCALCNRRQAHSTQLYTSEARHSITLYAGNYIIGRRRWEASCGICEPSSFHPHHHHIYHPPHHHFIDVTILLLIIISDILLLPYNMPIMTYYVFYVTMLSPNDCVCICLCICIESLWWLWKIVAPVATCHSVFPTITDPTHGMWRGEGVHRLCVHCVTTQCTVFFRGGEGVHRWPKWIQPSMELQIWLYHCDYWYLWWICRLSLEIITKQTFSRDILSWWSFTFPPLWCFQWLLVGRGCVAVSSWWLMSDHCRWEGGD